MSLPSLEMSTHPNLDASRWDVIVIGAGAAGLLAALTVGRSGARVLLVEATSDGGRKILIAGGGRCNILPSVPAPERFVTDSSRNTLKKILRSWPLPEQLAFFERELGQPLVREEETGKLFPASNRARDVRDGLLARVREAGVATRFGTPAHGLAPAPPLTGEQPREDGGTRESRGWMVNVGADRLGARAVVLATGGLSVPKTGSTGWGIDAASALGLSVSPTYPALTPLLADPPVHSDLAGVSLTVSIRAPGSKPRFETADGFLFTHRGYSGPSVLDASHLAVRSLTGQPQPLLVSWSCEAPAVWEERLRAGSGSVGAVLSSAMPKRLAATLAHEADVPAQTPLSQLSRDARKRLVRLAAEYPLPYTGDEGYKKAEVTGGGVGLSEVDVATLEAKAHPGLFLCGELLDAFGPIGGHNFMWAWATGRAAGQGAVRCLARRGASP